MALRQRRVYYFAVRAKQASKSSNYTEDHAYTYPEAVRRLKAGMVQEHYSHGNPNQEPELVSYEKISDILHNQTSTLILVERGMNERPAPMIGSHECELPPFHVPVGDKRMQASSCHVLLSHSARPDGTFIALLEGVPFVSKTAVQNFLNHLFFSNEEVRENTRRGYMIYFRIGMSALTDLRFADFLSRDGVETDFELLMANSAVDSNLDDSFDIIYRKKTTSNLLRDRIDDIWDWAVGRQNMQVRISAKRGGEKFSSEFVDLVADYQELRLGHSAVIDFEPPLANEHSAIDPHVKDELLELLRTAEE